MVLDRKKGRCLLAKYGGDKEIKGGREKQEINGEIKEIYHQET